MEHRTDKTVKKIFAGYNNISSSQTNPRQYYEDQTNDGNGADWQIRISILPEEANLQAAYDVLSGYFQNNKQDPSFEVKCLLLPQNDENRQNIIKDWDPIYLTGHHRSQRGREVCLYIGLKDNNIGEYVRTPDDWKALLLNLWSALQTANVEMGYTLPPSGDKVIPSENGLLVPFSYTSYKPYHQRHRKRHRILNEINYNPIEYVDPLEGMTEITWDDLTDAAINHGIVREQMVRRITNGRAHLDDMKYVIFDKLSTVNAMAHYNENYAPIDSSQQVVDKSVCYTLSDENAEQEIASIKENFKAREVVDYLRSLNAAGINIPSCIDKAPSEMQKIYRGIIHATHEKIALENDFKHGFMRAQLVKDLAIVSGTLIGSVATGAGIGALIGSFALPLVGTATGAVIGALFGGAIGTIASGYQALVRNRFFGGYFVYAEMVASSILFTLGSAGLGALIGTLLLPGVGTAIGAGAGFCLGTAVSAITAWVSKPDSEKMPTQLNNQMLDDIGNGTAYNNPYTNLNLQPNNTFENSNNEGSSNENPFEFQSMFTDLNQSEQVVRVDSQLNII